MLLSGITNQQKIAAIGDRDTQLSTATASLPPDDLIKRYEQILPIEIKPGVFIERHQYLGPKGIGYTDIVTVPKGRKAYRNSVHYGPETYRDVDNGVWLLMEHYP